MSLIFRLSVVVAGILTLALSATAPAQQLPLQYLTRQDGLANLSVNSLVQDRDGYLWAGTDNGLFRYNGAEFRRYAREDGLNYNGVNVLLADEHKRLWVGSDSGLAVLSGERLRPVLYGGRRLPVFAQQALALSSSSELLAISAKQLYVVTAAAAAAALADPGTDAGLAARPYFSAAQLAERPALGRLVSVLAAPGGALWLGCDFALCQAGPGGGRTWGVADGVPVERWLNIVRADDGVLWARGERHVIVLPVGATRFVDRTPPATLMRKISLSTALVEDADHRMLTTTDDGLARWSVDHWEFFDAANGLKKGAGVLSMLSDRDRGVWLGTGGHGLARWRGYDNWQNWTTLQGLPDDVVISFARDSAGRMRIGTRSGMAFLPERAGGPVLAEPDYPSHQWSSQALDHGGGIWAGSYNGLLVRRARDGGREVPVAQLNVIFRLLMDRQDRLWISTRKGLFVIEHAATASLRAAPTPAPGLAADSELATGQTRRSCESADGTLWFLSDKALWRLRGERWDSYRLDSDAKVNAHADVDVIACAADGSLWLGRGTSGLWRARVGPHGLEQTSWAVPMLRDKNLVSIHEDRRGWLWLGTDAGLVASNGRLWRQFDSNDGMVWDSVTNRPWYEDPDGTLWVPTANGASHIIHPERLFFTYPLAAKVESVTRDGALLDLADGDQLSWSSGALQFTMASLTYEHRGALRFHYRLAGLEQEWSSTTVPRLRYAALAPGKYRLQYAVENPDTQSQSSVRELEFSIRPPWWGSFWFYLLCGGAVLWALRMWYRRRVRLLHARNAEMETLVRQRTADLEDRTRELELSQEALRERALRDGLTKAWNRSAILEMLDQTLQKSAREHQPFLLILLDLDHFKRINDSHGHLAGDAVLREVVRRLNASVRPYDLVGRYGGEEFLVLLTDVGQVGGAVRVEALRRAIEDGAIDIGEGRTLVATASFGVAQFEPSHPAAALELVRRADEALYRAKEAGRNRIAYAERGPVGTVTRL